MSERTPDSTRHLDQSLPYEWNAVSIDDRTLIVRSIPEGTAECFVVSAVTRNVRALAQADALLYNGNVVEPWFDEELRTVEFCHDYGGKMGSYRTEEWLDEPAIRLKRLPSADLDKVVE